MSCDMIVLFALGVLGLKDEDVVESWVKDWGQGLQWRRERMEVEIRLQ